MTSASPMTYLASPRLTIFSLVGLGFNQTYVGHVCGKLPGKKDDASYPAFGVTPQAGRVALAEWILGPQGTAQLRPRDLPPQTLPRVRQHFFNNGRIDAEDLRLNGLGHKINAACGVNLCAEKPQVLASLKAGFIKHLLGYSHLRLGS